MTVTQELDPVCLLQHYCLAMGLRVKPPRVCGGQMCVAELCLGLQVHKEHSTCLNRNIREPWKCAKRLTLATAGQEVLCPE